MTELEKLQLENAEPKHQLEEFEKPKSIFANRLKQARKSAELTQLQLAERLGVARITLTQYERAVNEPNFSMLVKIAKLLNVSLDWLCGRTDKMSGV